MTRRRAPVEPDPPVDPVEGMRDLRRLMGVAATAQAALANVDLDSLTPEQLYVRFCDAAGGEANLRDLMNGAPLSARQIAPLISGAQAPAEPATPPTRQRRRVNAVDFDAAIREANRRAEERERPQGDAPDVDMSYLTPGEWVRVREEANIISFHLKGKSGRVCENQHTIHQSMADPDRWVTLWFPCDPETTHRIRKTALIGRGNIPDCTCNDIGHSPLHEDQCETAIFNSGVYIDGDRPDDDVPKPPSPPPPKRRKWGG